MTELINEKKCSDCAHHTGDACDNSNSDHYGHMLAYWHQACSQIDSFQDLPLCHKCKLEHVEQEGFVCQNCE